MRLSKDLPRLTLIWMLEKTANMGQVERDIRDSNQSSHVRNTQGDL
jgi:hypothetical protein